MASPRVAIVKYGVGNIYSVYAALKRVGANPTILEDGLRHLEVFDALVLPGVGSYPAAIRRLREWGIEKILEYIDGGGVVLGICLGMQLLFEESSEAGGSKGLGLLGGRVDRLNADRLPHIGWTRIQIRRQCRLLVDVPDNTYFYFMHSYGVHKTSANYVCATASHGKSLFAAVVEKHPIYGTQFHPERSGRYGRKVLENFIKSLGDQDGTK